MSDKLQTERLISKAVLGAVDALKAAGAIDASLEPGEVQVEKPAREDNGDYSVNTALKLAKQAKMNPAQLAGLIAGAADFSGLKTEKVQVAGGFINIFMKPEALQDELAAITASPGTYGRLPSNGRTVVVEYVSANPTGPLHLGNARGGAVGDVLANVLGAAGWSVTREFYLNDAGNQVKKFADSLEWRYQRLTDPDAAPEEDMYMGEDVAVLAEEFARLHPEAAGLDPGTRADELCRFALEANTASMRNDLTSYGIVYDVWFRESSLHGSGAVQRLISLLTEKGATYESDGALWFRATDYGCDKDEVLVRSNSFPTYFASDVAYHYDKFVERGFDAGVNVWGADHHGHVHRVKMALKAAGVEPDRLSVVLMQLVHLVKGERYLRLSKRRGGNITLADLLEAVGPDAARFLFNASSPASHMDFDMDKAVEQNNENPVFYVQYAHARMNSILKTVARPDAGADHSLLTDRSELALLRKMAAFSSEIAAAGADLDPSRMTKFAFDLATLFHSFYAACRVRTDDPALTAARLDLTGACMAVLRSALDLLGVSAPESM